MEKMQYIFSLLTVVLKCQSKNYIKVKQGRLYAGYCNRKERVSSTPLKQKAEEFFELE